MEIKLTFKEQEFKELYQSSYNELYEELNQKIKWRTEVIILLTFLTFAFFRMSSIYSYFSYLGFVSLFSIIAIIGWNMYLKYKLKITIEKKQKEVNEYINTIKNLHDIKYIYDDIEIKYFESNEIKDTFNWKDISHYYNNNNCIVLYFNEGKTSFMIPKEMTDKESFQLFEDKINEKLKNV